MTLTIDVCADKNLWNSFVRRSPQGSIFCHTDFLEAIGQFELYVVSDGGVPVLAVPVEMPGGGLEYIPYASYTTVRYAIYQGPMFSEAVEKMPLHRAVPYRLKSLDFLLEQLSLKHSALSFPLDPEFPDLRSFQWFNYHNEAGGRYSVNLRYTARLNLSQSTHTQHLEQVRSVRRQEYKRAEKAGITCEESTDISLLEALDEQVYIRQALERSDIERLQRRSIAESALGKGYGKLLVARCEDGAVASAYLTLFDDRTAYYLFAGNHPERRHTGASTYLMFHQLKLFRDQGKRLFDFIGVNSPNRGDFKTSFNAQLVHHYLVAWHRP